MKESNLVWIDSVDWRVKEGKYLGDFLSFKVGWSKSILTEVKGRKLSALVIL